MLEVHFHMTKFSLQKRMAVVLAIAGGGSITVAVRKLAPVMDTDRTNTQFVILSYV